MTKVNIIIIGAKNSDENINIDILNNYKRWNNPKQAYYNDLVNLKYTLNNNGYKHVKIFCLDPQYTFETKVREHDIFFIQKYFTVGDTTYCTKSGHNIFIEFSNMLDEYYVTKIKDFNDQPECISKYNNYKISWISCGCSWSQSFPSELICSLIKNEIYTPTNIYDHYSYLYAMNFNKLNGDPMFKPFSLGLYQILGSLLWRGFKDNYEYEEVLYKVLEKIISTIDQYEDEFLKFMNHEIHWNELPRNVREFINKYIYGENITVS
jgi:hypothetical protein